MTPAEPITISREVFRQLSPDLKLSALILKKQHRLIIQENKPAKVLV